MHNPRAYFGSLKYAIEDTGRNLLKYGRIFETKKWQALDVTQAPQGRMFELLDHTFVARMPYSVEQLALETRPNLPWAEDHFQERVGGLPLNPGEEYKNWPFFKRQSENDRHRDEEGKHSHTYMERIWTPDIQGIRYLFGNLGDVVRMLKEDPTTRQAYLPIWFPEDTGAVHGERVPCTLGYHFLIRNQELHIFYDIRSCDYYRHFRDDVYMAVRLAQWMIDQLPEHQLRPGKLRMNIHNLHIFEVEKRKLEKEFNA